MNYRLQEASMDEILAEGTRDDGEISDGDEEAGERNGDSDNREKEIAAAFERGRSKGLSEGRIEGELIGMMKASGFWRACFSFEDHNNFYIFLHKQSILGQDGETLITAIERVSISATPTGVTVTVVGKKLEEDFLITVLGINDAQFREDCDAEGSIEDIKELTQENSTYRHGMMTFKPSHRIDSSEKNRRIMNTSPLYVVYAFPIVNEAAVINVEEDASMYLPMISI